MIPFYRGSYSLIVTGIPSPPLLYTELNFFIPFFLIENGTCKKKISPHAHLMKSIFLCLPIWLCLDGSTITRRTQWGVEFPSAPWESSRQAKVSSYTLGLYPGLWQRVQGLLTENFKLGLFLDKRFLSAQVSFPIDYKQSDETKRSHASMLPARRMDG